MLLIVIILYETLIYWNILTAWILLKFILIGSKLQTTLPQVLYYKDANRIGQKNTDLRFKLVFSSLCDEHYGNKALARALLFNADRSHCRQNSRIYQDNSQNSGYYWLKIKFDIIVSPKVDIITFFYTWWCLLSMLYTTSAGNVQFLFVKTGNYVWILL